MSSTADVDVAFNVVGELSFESKLGFLDRGGDVDGMMVRWEI